MDIAFTIEADGKWDASRGTLDLELSADNVRCSIDKVDTGDEEMKALIQIGLSDSDAKKEVTDEIMKDFNENDFNVNGALSLNFRNDNTMKLSDDTGKTMVFHRK